MDENDIKHIVSFKLYKSMGERRLSDGFCGRLQASVRRMRRRWLMKVSAAVLAVVVACLAAVGFVDGRHPQDVREPALIAAETHHSDTNLSKLAFLGFFRECFKRNKTTKRKEDEQ